MYFIFCLQVLLSLSLICSVVEGGSEKNEVEYLGRMNVASGGLTVSGFSSGGVMATQMQVAFSKNFAGAAVFSSHWYRCSSKDEVHLFFICGRGLKSVRDGVTDARKYEKEGLIDKLSNLQDQRFYHWIGKLDEEASWKVRAATKTFYQDVGMKSENIFTQLNHTAFHFMPTVNSSNPLCTLPNLARAFVDPRLTGVAFCNYDGAFEGLSHIMAKPLSRPSRNRPMALGPLRKFNQSVFVSQANQKYLDPIGYFYVPSKCGATFERGSEPSCPVHMVLHGCLGSRSRVRDQFVRQSGFLEVAESNGIIMLFPQSIVFKGNQLGCWETWRMINDNFATKQGIHMTALAKMMETVSGRSLL